MPNRSRSKKRQSRPDANQLAAQLVARVTGQPLPKLTVETKNDAARLLGSLGGKKGGPARAAAMSPEERRASASKAARARWAKERD